MGKRIKSGQIQEEEEKKTNEASVIPGWVCALTKPPMFEEPPSQPPQPSAPWTSTSLSCCRSVRWPYAIGKQKWSYKTSMYSGLDLV